MKTKKDIDFIKFCIGAKIKSYYETIDMYNEEIKKSKGQDICYTYRELRLVFKKHLRTAIAVQKKLPLLISQ